MKDIIERFNSAIIKDRLSHLYLLSGSTTKVKNELVNEISALIFKSEHNDENIKKLIEEGNYPNHVVLQKDGLSIKKDQIMSLQKEFNKTSLVKGYRVYVIESADTMSQSAANSLLKFLEEPKSEKTIGFLLVDDINFVLPTILSRAQVIRIKEESQNSFLDLLVNEGIELKKAKYLSYFTNDLSVARTLINDPTILEAVSLYEEILKNLINQKSGLVNLMNKIVIKFGNDKQYIKFILELISVFLLDVMHLHMNQLIELDFKKDDLIEFMNKVNFDSTQELIRLTHDLIKNLRLPINLSLNFAAYAILVEEIIYNGRT